MSLRSVNLNLIPILQALLRLRSVANAAEALDLSPAATSEALGRLRVLLNDPLLVRVGRTMQLTPKAADLIEPVNRLCDEAEGLLHHGEQFDPTNSKRQFRIATNDSLVFLVARRLLDATRAVAPAVQIHFSEPQPDISRQMSSREIDLLLMPKIFTDHMTDAASIRFRTVLRDRVVIVFSGQHPLAKKKTVKHEDVAPYPQVLYNPPATTLEGRREREAIGEVAFNVVMRVAQLMQIPYLVANPPYVSWLPKSLADRLREPLQLEIRDEKFSSSHNLDVCLAWSSVHEKDPAHRWFRNLVADTLAHD